MGLGAPKRRNKLSHDPNNTAWSRSTTNFGHRILSQQGWQPGQYLGAENANHSDHYTAANASHIRVLLREDNLGLGAKVGGNKAETFGLSLFSGVLGRLNGKDDQQVHKQQDSLRDAELRQYQVGKYGLMNFVSGGLLVGDKMEKPGEKGSARTTESETLQATEEQRGRKRKARDDDRLEEQGVMGKKTRTQEFGGDTTNSAIVTERSDKNTKKDKRRSARSDKDEPSESASSSKKSKKKRRPTDVDGKDSVRLKISKDDKARLKQEKRARKEDRRRRKEEKRAKKQTKTKAAATPSAPAPGRHAVRHRYIQQKRMAGMDARAMKEIFMVKGAA